MEEYDVDSDWAITKNSWATVKQERNSLDALHDWWVTDVHCIFCGQQYSRKNTKGTSTETDGEICGQA
jgi:hypothetical protein